MMFIAAIATGIASAGVAYAYREAIAGILGELNTPKDASSPEFKKRQAIREYNDLLGRTDPTEPAGSPCIKCLSTEKGKRREKRHDLIKTTQNTAQLESDPAKKRQILSKADRLLQDMDRVEDARLSLHTYTANEDLVNQENFLKPLRDQPPPGFNNASLEQVAKDFGVNLIMLKGLVHDYNIPTQRIMIYERDVEILGPGPKYTVAFRGSTADPLDWNNNGRNEAGFEAPHQKKAARLGALLKDGAAEQGKSIDSLVNTTGHSKGGSEAQAFAAASGASARVFNPAGFDPKQYTETSAVTPDMMHIDRTTVIDRDADGRVIESTRTEVHTDPLYYAQYEGLTRIVMKKPVPSGPPRELAPIDPDLSVPSKEQSVTEAHSLLQVIEALERDKEADQEAMKLYVGRASQDE